MNGNGLGFAQMGPWVPFLRGQFLLRIALNRFENQGVE